MIRRKYGLLFGIAVALATYSYADDNEECSCDGIEIWQVDYDTLFDNDPLWFEYGDRLENIPLAELPLTRRIVRDREVLAWDWDNQTVLLSSSAIDRMPRAGERELLNCWFLVILDGRPLYLGGMTTKYSSDSQRNPMILVDDLPKRPSMAAHRIKIDKCYPSTLYEIALDDDTRFNDDLLSHLKDSSRIDDSK